MFDATPDAPAAASVFHLVPLPALALPAGFRRWQASPPGAKLPVKAVLTRPGQYRVVRGTRDAILQRHPGWTPHAWQRLPPEQELSHHWHAFPEVLPSAGLACRVLYFDLRGTAPASIGYGRYRGGWPFGDFEQREAGSGSPPPDDTTRWAACAWRALESLEVGGRGTSANVDMPAASQTA